MAKLSIKAGSTSKLVRAFILDSSSSTGAGLTGLVFNTSFLTAYYIKEGDASATSMTLITMTVGTWASLGFKEVDATNMPGLYEIGLPNAAIASGKSVVVMLKGATNMTPTLLEIELTANDNQDSVRGGMTALPNAAAAASGGLPTVDTANAVKTQYPLHKNTAYTNFMIFMVLSSDHITPATGKTVSGTVSLDGAAFGALTNSISEVASGWYKVNLAAGDLNGTEIALKFTASGTDTVNIKIPLAN